MVVVKEVIKGITIRSGSTLDPIIRATTPRRFILFFNAKSFTITRIFNQCLVYISAVESGTFAQQAKRLITFVQREREKRRLVATLFLCIN